jgi:hypothetical protein
MQIFQQLLLAGKHHSLSAGLLIGGKNVKEEKDTVNRMVRRPASRVCTSSACPTNA